MERFSAVANAAMAWVYRDQAGRNTADIHRVICIRVESVPNSEADTFCVYFGNYSDIWHIPKGTG